MKTKRRTLLTAVTLVAMHLIGDAAGAAPFQLDNSSVILDIVPENTTTSG